MTVIGFVPARGGSQRIPRKNLRAVQGIPLVARTIRNLHAAGIGRVVCSTDDAEIADVARLWGAEIDVRPPALADATATIDQVVREWLTREERKYHDRVGDRVVEANIKRYHVVVAQPTSPLLTPASIANAVDYATSHHECVFTTVAERHLLWDSTTRPLYSARRNSNEPGDADYYRETGGLVVFRVELGHESEALRDDWPPRPCTMMELDEAEAIDIDDYADLTRARAGQKPARIQLRYVESREVGSGHRRRCETLAVELMGRHMVDVVEDTKAALPGGEETPDLVVLDVLDTTAEQIADLRGRGVKHVVTLEDVGAGTMSADFTVNELYHRGYEVTTFGEERVRYLGARYHGPRFAVLRPEFQGHSLRPRPEKPITVVVSFGGTDPAHMTEDAFVHLATVPAIQRLRVIVPPGRSDFTWPSANNRVSGGTIEVVRNPCMAAEFLGAHLAVTSAGRTVHEAAACGVPVIAVAVNEREQAHDVCPGVFYKRDGESLAEMVEAGLQDPGQLMAHAAVAHAAVDGLGAQRICWLVDGLLGGLL